MNIQYICMDKSSKDTERHSRKFAPALVHQLHYPQEEFLYCCIVVIATSNSQNDTMIIFLADSEQEYFSNTSIHQSC